MLSQPPTYLKAIVAGILAGLAALAGAVGGEPSMTAAEWVTVGTAAVVAFGAVYGIPNARTPAAARAATADRGSHLRGQRVVVDTPSPVQDEPGTPPPPYRGNPDPGRYPEW